MKIYITGLLDNDSNALKKFNEEYEESKSLEVVITSEGGDTDTALAIYNVLEAHGDTTIATGNAIVASAAVLVYAACRYRRAYRHTVFMLHEFSSEAPAGSTKSFMAAALNQQREQRWYAELISKACCCPVDKILLMMHNETYLDAEQAKELGLVHEII